MFSNLNSNYASTSWNYNLGLQSESISICVQYINEYLADGHNWLAYIQSAERQNITNGPTIKNVYAPAAVYVILIWPSSLHSTTIVHSVDII